MMNLFRQNGIAQVLMGGVVVLIIATFAVSYGRGGSLIGREPLCVAEVFGECLSQTDYDANYRLAVFPGASAKQLRAIGFPKDVVEGLVERELLLREAKRLELSVSDESVDDELFAGRFHFSLPADRYGGRMLIRPSRVNHSKTGQFDYGIYKREVINLTRMTPKEFKVRQRDEIIAHRLRELVMGQVRVSDAEVRAKFEREKTTATVDVVRLSTRWFGRYALRPTAEAVAAYALANTAALESEWEKVKSTFTPGCTLASEIVVALSPASSDEDKQTASSRIASAKERLDRGEDFRALAREFGSDEAAFAGGDIGCLNDTTAANKTLLEAASKLAPGETSAAIETERGFHLLRSSGTLDAAKAEATGKELVRRRLFAKAHSEELARRFASALIARARAGETLKDVVADAARHELTALTTNAPNQEALLARALADSDAPRVRTQSQLKLGANPLPEAELDASAIVFGLQQVGQAHPEPVPVPEGFAVLQLREKQTASPEEFEKNKAELKDELRSWKGAEVLQSYVARLREDAAKHVKVNEQFLAEVVKSVEANDG